MYCPKCGSPNEKTAKFCIKCGKRLPVSDQPEAKLPAPTPPPDTQQRQGHAMPQPAAPSKAKSRSKLVFVILAVILVLLLILAAELILLLTGWPEQTPTPAAIATLPATVGTPGASPSPSSAVASSPSATVTPLPSATPTVLQEVPAQSDVPSLIFSSFASSYAIAGGKVFLEVDENQTQAIAGKTGDVIWTANTSGRIIKADEELVYIRPSELRVDALDANTGQFRWRYLSEESGWPVGGNDTYVLFSAGSDTHVMDKQTGNRVFSVERGQGGWQLQGKALVGDNKFGLLSDDGHMEWVLSDVWFSRFCDGMFVYRSTGGSDGLGAIDANTGSPLWKSSFIFESYNTNETIICPTENIYLYVNGRRHAFSRDTGELLWRGIAAHWAFSEYKDDTFNCLGEVDGMIVYSHIGYGLTQAYDATNHRLLWENPQFVLSDVVGVLEGTLIGVIWQRHSAFDEAPGIVVGLDPQTGKELWRGESGIIESVHLMEGRLFYTKEGQPEVRFLDPRSGVPIVSIPFDKHIDSHRTTLTDGMIVMVGDDTTLFSDLQEQVIIIRP
jgi:outer membrane protein assembly factor BamB